MSIKPLNSDEIRKMERVCKIAGETLLYLDKFMRVGISTNEIDQLINDYTLTRGATSAPLGYHGFPKAVCTSVNQVVCHGVPDDQILKEGDIINVDVTPFMDGFFGDTSKTYILGKASVEALNIVETAYQAMMRGIEVITPNGRTGDIGFEIDKFVTRKGYSTVKEIGGHGVGRKFHEEPFIPSFGKKGKGDKLVPFHCITVEPMINQGTDKVVEYDIPNSTIKYYHTEDGLLSAQFEHTVLVTDTGFEVLTLVS